MSCTDPPHPPQATTRARAAAAAADASSSGTVPTPPQVGHELLAPEWKDPCAASAPVGDKNWVSGGLCHATMGPLMGEAIDAVLTNAKTWPPPKDPALAQDAEKLDLESEAALAYRAPGGNRPPDKPRRRRPRLIRPQVPGEDVVAALGPVPPLRPRAVLRAGLPVGARDAGHARHGHDAGPRGLGRNRGRELRRREAPRRARARVAMAPCRAESRARRRRGRNATRPRVVIARTIRGGRSAAVGPKRTSRGGRSAADDPRRTIRGGRRESNAGITTFSTTIRARRPSRRTSSASARIAARLTRPWTRRSGSSRTSRRSGGSTSRSRIFRARARRRNGHACSRSWARRIRSPRAPCDGNPRAPTTS